jgi:hypothetical protein
MGIDATHASRVRLGSLGSGMGLGQWAMPHGSDVPASLKEARFMAGRAPVKVEHRGRLWVGEWQVDGEEIVVVSEQGSEREPLGGKEPERMAARLLREIVDRSFRRR